MKHFNVFIRSPYNYSMEDASSDSGLVCPEETLAQQQFKEECDINVIVRNFGLTGEMPGVIRTPLQGDFTEVTDYQTAMNLLLQAQEAFLTIPAEVRAEFQNDPQRFLEFASDPANLPRMKEMGLGRVERPLPAPVDVRLVPTPQVRDGNVPSAAGPAEPAKL